MKRKWPIVEVEWEDSVGWSSWTSEDDVLECTSRKNGMLQYTSGYLMKRDKRYIIVTSVHADTESSHNVCGAMQIPRSAIRSLRILKEKE